MNRSTVPSQTPQWLDAVCALGPFADASRLYEGGDGVVHVLPLVRSTAVPAALATEYSMAPTWGSGGLLGAQPPGAAEVLAVARELVARPVLRTVVRPDFEQAPLWDATRSVGTVAVPVVHHVLDLDTEFENLHRRFSKMARKAIRRAEKLGVTVGSDTTGRFLTEFNDLYEGWVDRRAQERGVPLWLARRRGRRNEPFERLQLLDEVLGDTFRVWVAWLDGRAVASMITLVHGDVALAWRAASDKEAAGPARAMDLLHRHAIEFACRSGCRYYNMGESGGVASLMRFKERFGATPRHHAAHQFERVPISSLTRPLVDVRGRAERLAVGAVGRLRN